MRKTRTATAAADTPSRELFPDDNRAPDRVPAMLAGAEDVPAIVREDVAKATADALRELDVFARAPGEIADAGVYERVVTLSTRIKAVLDATDKSRTAHKAPYLAAGKAVDEAFRLDHAGVDGDGAPTRRVLKTELEGAHKALKGRLSAYDTRVHLAEQARIADERAALAKAAAADGIAMADAPVAAAAPGSLRSAHGGSAVRKVVRTWTVVDIAKVPRSLLRIDEAKVQEMLDQGAETIPGIAFSEVVETHTQRR